MKAKFGCILLLLFFSGLHGIVQAQKPALDTMSLVTWPEIGDQAVSPDGRYVSYTIVTPDKGAILYLRSALGNYLHRSAYIHGEFTEDSKCFIYQAPGDSLCIFDLESKMAAFRSGVQTYQVPVGGDGRWLAYKTVSGDWVVEDLFSKKRKNFTQVHDIQFSPAGNILLLKGMDSTDRNWLKWINLESGSEVTLCKGSRTSNILFDQGENALAFVSSQGNGEQAKSVIRLYRKGMDSAAVAVDENTIGIEKGFHVKEDGLTFSADGKKLFFTLHRPERAPGYNPLGASVDIWNYKDEYSQGMQLENPSVDHLVDFRAVLKIENGKVLRLEEEKDGGDEFAIINNGANGNYLLTMTKWNENEQEWRPEERPSLYIVNTDDGRRKLIASKGSYDQMRFSPGGNYVIWFDQNKRAYFSYNLRTGICRNISARIPFSLQDEQYDLSVPGSAFCYGVPTWLACDSSVLVYDRYDIWALDPNGERAPVELTNGLGRRHKIVLRCAYVIDKVWPEKIALKSNGDLLLCAADETTKENGFYRLNIRRPTDPVRLVMSPAVFYFADVPSYAYIDFLQHIYKAEKEDEYLLTRSSPTEYPNLLLTSDFRHFTKLTDLQPQKRFNWMTSELLRWSTFKGHAAEGILYKPEDFDPKKKYPVIINYYERKGDGLNIYYSPAFSISKINIPWFVSHGYLVFCPDIHYTPGDPGAGVYDYVVSAASLLKKKPWVDGKHIGLQGHSFAGFETDYLITRTNLFAAAMSAAGITDMFTMGKISQFWPTGDERYVQYSQLRMKYAFWERPDLYIGNSAAFQVSRINTPLLLMANKADGSVPWEQGEELFMGLRRLRKPVWMLQYDRGDHGVFGRDAVDYTLRMTQFFDHYLKGAPEPKWMKENIPLRNKGLDNYMEY